MAFVYVLRCGDNSYYTGATKNWEERIVDHQKGKVKYTKSRLPIKLIFLKEFDSFKEALRFEDKVKSWKKRLSIEKMLIKKDNLVKDRFNRGPVV